MKTFVTFLLLFVIRASAQAQSVSVDRPSTGIKSLIAVSWTKTPEDKGFLGLYKASDVNEWNYIDYQYPIQINGQAPPNSGTVAFITPDDAGNYVVGWVSELDARFKATTPFTVENRLDGPTYQAIDVPGAILTQVRGINDNYQMVGYYRRGDNTEHGFLFDHGIIDLIDVPNASMTFASGINNAGQIVGYYQEAADSAPLPSHVSTRLRGFLYERGQFTTLDFPSSDLTVASGINSQGQIVGHYLSQGIDHGFLWDHGSFTSIDLGSGPTEVNGIDDQGQIAGSFKNAFGKIAGFVRDAQGRFGNASPGGQPTMFWAVRSRVALGQFSVSGKSTVFYSDPVILINGGTISQTTNPYHFDTKLAPKEWASSVALGLNKQFSVVGYYVGQDGMTHGFLIPLI